MNTKIIRAVIDRIEDKMVVLEIEGSYELVIPLKFLPENSKPGNILEIAISANPEAEEAQREKIRKMQEKLKGN